MLLVRSPLRISLGGGGTDLPSYYQRRGGYLLAGSINKYVYTNIVKPFSQGIYLKYSELEKVDEPSLIKHKIFREILSMRDDFNHQIEITTLADVPAGTGLGSSGAFIVSLLKALSIFDNNITTNENIAKLACHVEIDRLKEPVGKQDQYASAIGGINEFIFHKNDEVEFKKLNISPENLLNFEESLLMFFTGYSRSASDILSVQNSKTSDNDTEMIHNLDRVKEMGKISKILLEKGDIYQYGLLMNDHWRQKIKRSPDMCSQAILNAYEEGINNGAIGGKLVGAGGGGFLLFVADDRAQLRKTMREKGLVELPFRFDKLGAHVLSID